MNNSSNREEFKGASTGIVSFLYTSSHISGDLALIIKPGKDASSSSVQPRGSAEDIPHLH